MNGIELIGLAAAVLTTASFLPQVIKVIKTNDTQALSLTMYITFVIGISCWLAYGIAINDMPIIFANIITLLLSAVILVKKIINRKTDKAGTTQIRP
ncbi:MAG: SemiSWEET transporter [Glaciecola sp.]